MSRAVAVEPLLSEAEAAAELGIEKEALARLRRAGRAPLNTWVGRFPKYARKHVLAYLAANAQGAPRGR